MGVMDRPEPLAISNPMQAKSDMFRCIQTLEFSCDEMTSILVAMKDRVDRQMRRAVACDDLDLMDKLDDQLEYLLTAQAAINYYGGYYG